MQLTPDSFTIADQTISSDVNADEELQTQNRHCSYIAVQHLFGQKTPELRFGDFAPRHAAYTNCISATKTVLGDYFGNLGNHKHENNYSPVEDVKLELEHFGAEGTTNFALKHLRDLPTMEPPDK